MMKNKVVTGVLAVLLASQASAKTGEEMDTEALRDAFAAMKARDFPLAVSKADGVIARFEGSKASDTDYVCTSGSADTLVALTGAVVAKEKGTAKKPTTAAISTNICTAYFLKGFALVDLQRRDEALPALEAAMSLDPDNQHYANELAEWYKVGRQWQKALDLFTKASEITDLSIDLMDDKKEARRVLNDMRCRSYRGIAFSHVEMEQWKEARSALEKCLALIPDEPKSKAELEYIKTKAGG